MNEVSTCIVDMARNFIGFTLNESFSNRIFINCQECVGRAIAGVPIAVGAFLSSEGVL